MRTLLRAIAIVLALHAEASALPTPRSDGILDLAEACTSIIVADGGGREPGTMTSHTDDCAECDFRLSKVPAADHAPGSVRNIYSYRAAYPRYLGYDRGPTYEPENTDLSWYPHAMGEGEFAPVGSLPQVPHTYAYLDGTYGIMNEHSVAIGESTCAAALTAASVGKGGAALLEIADLSRLALERCTTARCAVELMGGLAVAHGFHGADETQGEGGESLQVTDPAEAWVFHVTADDSGASAVWAAQRVPRGHIAAVANQFIIRTVKEAHADFLSSGNLLEVAERAGLWDRDSQGDDVDFTQAFGMPALAGTGATIDFSPYSNRRRWRILSLAAPSLGLSPQASSYADEYPFSVKVETPGGLSVADLQAMLRDHYEGTPYDMTKGLAAGPWGDPSRFDPGSGNGAVYAELAEDRKAHGANGHWLPLDGADDDFPSAAVARPDVLSGRFERAVSIYRASYAWVSQSAPAHVVASPLLGTVWFGQYAPHASAFVPLYAGATALPGSLTSGSLHSCDLTVAYWVHALLGNWAARFYVHAMVDVRAAQRSYEMAQLDLQPSIRAQVAVLAAAAGEEGTQDGADPVGAFLTAATAAASSAAMESFGGLVFRLFAKFKDGQRLDDLHAATLKPTKMFYPKWWLTAVGFFDPMPGAPEGAAAEVEAAFAAPSGPTTSASSSSSSSSFFWLVFSHAAVACLAVAATSVRLAQRQQQSGGKLTAGGVHMVGNMPPPVPAVRSYTYQQVP